MRQEERYHGPIVSKKALIMLAPIAAVLAIGDGIKSIGRSMKKIFKRKEK